MIHFVRRNRNIPQEKRASEEESIFSVSVPGKSWENISGVNLFTCLEKEFRDRIKNECFGKYESRHLDNLQLWLYEDILPVVDDICVQNPSISRLITGEKRKLFEDDMEKLLLRAFGETMATDMFRMCIEYPDSNPILLDLRRCLKLPGIRDVMVENLKGDLERRLLHTGVTTVDVVEAYVSVVRCLKFLDPDGILIQLVTPPVREYLKQREETIRVILVSLTDETGDLSEELIKNPTVLADKLDQDTKWQTWVPDPIDVPRDKHNLREADLIHTFVSIYGSKTLFIDEYRALLADRLLKMPKPASVPRELKCLELLKLRFGDSDLQKCEVMLKDVADSQRMNTRFRDDHPQVLSEEQLDFSSLIVSAQFWPTFKSETLELPPPVSDAVGLYTKVFEGIKGNRSLEWHTHIGTVEIEMEHFGKTTTYNCSPFHAAILWHFQEKSRWTLDELAAVTKAPVASLRSRIRFWVTRGVLVLSKTDTYSLQEEDGSGKGSQGSGGSSGTKYMEDEEMDSPMTSTNALRETELQMFWSYIEGMLTNLGTLPLTRIHSMLKLFATVECSSEELQKFLDDKVSQGILVYSAGQYQLQK